MTKYYSAHAITTFNKHESFYLCAEGNSEDECRDVLKKRLITFANTVSDKYFNRNRIKAVHITEEEYYNSTSTFFWEIHRLEFERSIMNLVKKGENNGT